MREEDWGGLDEDDLEDLVDEALIDACDMSEACAAFCQLIEEELRFPFEAKVFGIPVEVLGVEVRESYGMAFSCRANGVTQAMDVLDLPMPKSSMDGAQWVYAYRFWAWSL